MLITSGLWGPQRTLYQSAKQTFQFSNASLSTPQRLFYPPSPVTYDAGPEDVVTRLLCQHKLLLLLRAAAFYLTAAIFTGETPQLSTT